MNPVGKSRSNGFGEVVVSIVLASYCSRTQSPPGLGAISFSFLAALEVKEEVALALSG